MANTLTGLVPILYEALDTVSREMVGFIPAVRRDTGVDRAAKDQSVRFPVVPQGSLENITPGQNPADSGDQTIGYDTVTLDNAKAYPVRWTGEEERSLKNGEGKYEEILRDQFAQGFRTLVNTMEADIAALYAKASRAYGTAGTTPFGTAGDLSDIAYMKKILNDNGAPVDMRNLVFNSSAGANLGGVQSTLFKVNEAGTDALLRDGLYGRVNQFGLYESGQIKTHTAGTASSATTDDSGYSVGDTEIALDSAGTGTILAGDVITFAGDDNKYLVVSGDTDVSDGGTITIASPGLQQSIAASTTAITVVDDYVANMGFHRNSLLLAVRPPARPEGGDMAEDVMMITDPVTGMSFEIAMYKEYKRVKYEIGAVWGVKAVKPEHMAVLLG